MFKRFLDGLAFGTGFAIAFVAVWNLLWFFLLPAVYERQIPDGVVLGLEEIPEPAAEGDQNKPRRTEFERPSLEERVAEADAIALISFEPADDGLMRAMITEYLKGDSSVQNYEVGEEVSGLSFYPGESRYGEGAVIYFKGPRRGSYGASYIFDGRLPSYYDMPVEMYREKLAEILAEEEE